MTTSLVMMMCFWMVSQTPPADQEVTPKIVSASLFKNGLSFIAAEIALPGPGSFVMTEVPQAIHGTFWIQAPAGLDVSVTEREVDEPLPVAGNPLLEADGEEITIHFRDNSIPAVKGKLVTPRPKDPARPRGHFDDEDSSLILPRVDLFVVDTSEGRVYVNQSDVRTITASTIQKSKKLMQPVLRLVSTQEGAQSIRYHYLARGLGWAPSYRVDIANPTRLEFRQNAVVLNELADFKDAELSLITGFPNIEFAYVTSPLIPGTTWESFFNQIQNRQQDESRLGAQTAAPMMNQYRAPSASDNLPPPAATGEEVDLHYESIGKRSLKRNESLAVVTGVQPADYERIVEWKVPKARSETGEPVRTRSYEEDGTKDVSDAWDALRFRNPFPFPVTTGPAMIVAGDRFLGQRLLTWANPGAMMVLRVNKALSVETSFVEFENDLQQQPVMMLGTERYRKPLVTVKLRVKNGRAEPIKMVIDAVCFGEILRASDNPVTRLAERSGYSLNKRRELSWTVLLLPNVEKEIVYEYEVLVPMR